MPATIQEIHQHICLVTWSFFVSAPIVTECHSHRMNHTPIPCPVTVWRSQIRLPRHRDYKDESERESGGGGASDRKRACVKA